MSEISKKHKQSKYFTIMLVPDSTSRKVRSLKVPHWFLFILSGIVVVTACTISGLGALNTYSKIKLEQTVKIVEETEHEKQELLDEKEQIQVAKQRIEKSFNNQKGDFDKQLEFYGNQIAEVEAKLIEIENQTKDSYEKMNVGDSPISMSNIESFMGGHFTPEFDEGASNTDKLNMQLAALNIQFDKTESFIKKYTEDVDKYVEYKSAIPTIWPVTGNVTSEYGGRSDPFTGASASHSGIDIKVPTGTYVKATGNGVVKRAEYSTGYGYLIVIDHGYGIETYYAHNSELLLNAGDPVKRGDYVSKSGSTGRSTGPHVHYEVRVGGVIKDPRDYLGDM